MNDAALARRIAAAPGEAREEEEELARRFASRIRMYGLRHLRDRDAANDLVQQVLLVTLESLRKGRVRDPERLASFVLGTCRNVARDLRRGGRRRQDLLERHLAVPGERTVEPPVAPPFRLADCLHALAERERSVLVMTFYAERSADEIARELGILSGNVRVIRHRALRRLRDCLEAES
jgi:RNA polymerase sigma-70 factor (ECF subfamily)